MQSTKPNSISNAFSKTINKRYKLRFNNVLSSHGKNSDNDDKNSV